MTIEQHEQLLRTLKEIQGKFQLSGYHCPLYDDIAAKVGWRCEELLIDNKASSAETKEIKIECLWMNF